MRLLESFRPLTFLFAALLTLLPLQATSLANGVTVTGVQKTSSMPAASGRRSQYPKLGPCIQASGVYVVPGGCEPSCYVYCTDPCSEIVWDHADCQNYSGPCKRGVSSLSFYMCRDCSCTWPYGGCADLGLYENSSTDVLVCK